MRMIESPVLKKETGKIEIKINEAATVSINVRDDKILWARMKITGMPMQPRDHFGKINQVTLESFIEGLNFYGFTIQKWVDNVDSETSKKVLEHGILSSLWFFSKFGRYFDNIDEVIY